MASASGAGGPAWVSSLGNTFGSNASSSTNAPASGSSSSTAAAFGNPFANATVAATAFATPVAPSQIGSKEDKNSMMAAFSDMGLALDASVPTTATGSSSKALLAKKESERQQEQQAEAEHHARRQARLNAKNSSAKPPPPASALMQAIDAFAGEVSQSDTFSSALGSRKATTLSSLAGGARRSRHKQEKAHDKARGGKSVRDIKRLQRREQYRHVY